MTAERIQDRSWVNLILIIALFIGVNIAGQYYYTKIDLTEEKRFTLTPATVELIEGIDQPVFIEVLLEGEFPAGFKRLQNALQELLLEFKSINNRIQFRFEDPLEGSAEEVEERLQSLAQVGIVPTELNVRDREGSSKRRIYPYAIFNYSDRQIAINLLENETPGIPPEIALNNSISLLEYKSADAISKLLINNKSNILFSSGHGELSLRETASLEQNLRAFYNTGRVNLDSIYQIPREVEALVIAKPSNPFSEKAKFVLDQYIMSGGNVLFLLDPLVVNLDSIQAKGQYVPHDSEVNLDDMLFRYGARLNRNLVVDFECSQIPMVVGKVGSRNQFELLPWYYHPLAAGNPSHPITKGLDRVDLRFPATIDTLKTKTAIEKTILLSSSQRSRLQYSPVVIDFEILKAPPDPSIFDDGPQPLAVLLEGPFASLYENRVTPAMKEGLVQIGADFIPQGIPARILIVADGDVAANVIDRSTGQPRPLGYNPYMQYTFANQSFLVNTIEYMLDRSGLIEARSKSVKLRLLDQARIESERGKWQLINVVVPIALLFLFGVIFHLWRKRKYAR